MNPGQRKEVSTHTDFIVASLVEKLGDNLAKVRQNAENAILAMCNHDAFGVTAPITHVLRNTGQAAGPANKAKKTMNSNKLIIGKY